MIDKILNFIARTFGVEYIIEREKDPATGWLYTKWKSGYCEAEYYHSSSSAFVTPYCGGYESVQHSKNLPTGLFKTVNPIMVGGCANVNGAVLENPRVDTKHANWFLLAGAKQTTAITTQTMLRVTGTWK